MAPAPSIRLPSGRRPEWNRGTPRAQTAVTRRRVVPSLRGLRGPLVILTLSIGITLVVWRYTTAQQAALARQAFHQFTPLEERVPLLLLVGGMLISLQLFGMLASLATSRRRAVRIAEGMTQAWRTNQNLLMARTSQQTAVAEISQQALADVDLSMLFDYAVSLVAKTLSIDLCEDLELRPDGTALELRAGVGWRDGVVGQATTSADPASQAGYTLQTSSPVVVEDLRPETQFAASSLLREHGAVSGISVVIPGQERPFGVLGAHTKSLRRFSDDDVQFLQNMANVLAAAIRRRHLERQLRERGEALERSLADLQATQLQLIQAEKLESVGRLAAGVAHEVKNPLAILLMGAEYLTKHVADGNEAVQTVLHDMAEAAKRADRVIKELLGFSASQQLDVRQQALRPVIEQALLLVKHELTRAHVTAVTRVAEDVPPLAVDQQKMEQVFVNLFMNAAQAMPDGGTLTITAMVTRLVEVGRGVGRRATDRFHVGDEAMTVMVEDTGAGIPAEKLHKIFDPFFTTKPPGQGTGLGLTVVQKIIALHGGTIHVTNRSEGGVRVTMLLPITWKASG